MITIKKINSLLGLIKSANAELVDETITQEMIDKITKSKYYTLTFTEIEDLNKLIGYTIEFGKDGDHRNDGQMVDYSFSFISPEGKETTIDTEMCLMVGFNVTHQPFNIN